MNARILADAKIIYDYLSGHIQPTEKADFLLALGSHDLMVPVFASELFAEKMAPLIVCSGGFGKITREIWNEEEGKVFAKKCIEMGVPKEKILIEKNATNTGENFTLTRALLEKEGIKVDSGIIICKPYMAKRALATARKQWPEVEWRVAVKKVPLEEYISDEDLEREINVMVGDMQRMKTYAEAGFQVPVNIPDDVWDAYKRLVRAGYTEYVQ